MPGMKIADMFVELGLRTEKFAKGFGDAESKLKSMGQKFTAAGMTLTAGLTLPIVGVGAAALKMTMDFEKSMNKVAALTENVALSAEQNTAQFEKLERQARDLGKATVFTATEAAEGMGFLAMAGFKVADIYQTLPGVLNLAAAGQMDLARAADITSNIMTSQMMTAQDMAHVNDALAQAFSSANVDLTMLGESFKYAGSIGKGVGMQFEEMAATLGLLGQAGIQGSMGGTTLRQTLAALLSPSTKATKLLKEMEITIESTTGKMLPLADIIAQFERELKESGNELEMTGKILDIFGKRGGPGLKALLGIGSEALRDFTADIVAADGKTEAMSKTMLKGLSGAVKIASSALQDLMISIGKNLAPVAEDLARFFTKVANKLSELVQKFGELPRPIQTFAIAATALVAAIGPLLMAFGLMATGLSALAPLAGVLGSVGGAFVTFGGVVGKVFVAIKAFSFTSLFASMNAAALGFGKALVAAFTGVPAMLAGVGAKFGALSTVIVGFGSSLKALGFAGIMAKIVASFGSLGTVLSGAGLAGAFAAAKGALIAFGTALLTIGWPIAAIIAAAVALAAVAYTVYKHWNEIKDVLVGLFHDLANLIGAALKWIWDGIQSVLGPKVTAVIVAVWKGIVGFFKAIWKGIVDIFQNGLKYIVNWLNSVAQNLKKWIPETASAMQRWADKLNDVAQPAIEGAAVANDELSDSFSKIPQLTLPAIAGVGGFGDAADGASTKVKQLQKRIEALGKDVAKTMSRLPQTFEEFSRAIAKGGVGQAEASIEKLKQKLVDLGIEWGDNLPVKVQRYMDEIRAAIQQQEEFLAAWRAEDVDAFFVKMDASLRKIGEESLPKINFESAAWKAMATEVQLELAAAAKVIADLDEATKTLGFTTSQEWLAKIKLAEEAYNAVEVAVKANEASAIDLANAMKGVVEVELEAARALGKNAEEIERLKEKLQAANKQLSDFGVEGKNAAETTEEAFDEMWKQVSTIFTDMSKKITTAILEGKSLGDVFVNTFKAMGEAVARFVIEFVAKQLLTSLVQATSQVQVLGAAFSKLFGDFGAGAGGLGGKGGGAGTGGGGGGAAAEYGNLATMGPVGWGMAAFKAVMDTLSFFQGKRMEKDIARIEVTSREIKELCISHQESFNEWLPWLENIAVRLHESLDLPISQAVALLADGSATNVEAMLEKIGELQTSNEQTGEKLEKAQQGTSHTVEEVQKQVQASGDTMASATEGVNMSVQQSTAQLEFVSQAIAQGNALADLAIQSNTGMLMKVRMAVDGVANQLGSFVGTVGTQEDTRNYLAYLVLLENFDVKLSEAVNTLVEHLGGNLELVSEELKKGLENIKQIVEGLVVVLDKVAKVSKQTGQQTEQAQKTNTRNQNRSQQAVNANTGAMGSLGTAVQVNTQSVSDNTQVLARQVTPALGLLTRSREEGMESLNKLIARLERTGFVGGMSEAQMSGEQMALLRSIRDLARQVGASIRYPTSGRAASYEGPAGVTGGPWAGSNVNMNFYGVTNPSQMADKIVSGLRLKGVDI